MADQPWHALPREIAGILRPLLTDVAGEMIDAVREIPAYARPVDGPFGGRRPRSLAAVAIGREQRERAAARLPPESIADVIGDVLCALGPDPEGPGRRAAIERAVIEAGASAGLGTTVAWSEAPVSFSRARGALELAGGAPSLAVAREKAGELLLRSEPRLGQELARDRLGPLAELPTGSRTRL